MLELQEKAKRSKSLKVSVNIGKLEADFIKKNVESDKETFWYFSGPSGMIDALTPRVLSSGAAGDHLKFEEYYPHLASERRWDLSEKLKGRGTNAYKLATDDSLIHTVITDVNGRILYANNAASRITGFSIHELLGNTPRLWGGLMDQSFYTELWRTIKIERKPFTGKVRNRKKTGEHYTAQLVITPMVEPGGELIGFNASENDITELERVDQVKTEFASLVSHQLRTPFSTINWYIELLLAGDVGRLSAKQTQYLEEVYHASRRMVDLISVLLRVSRIEMGILSSFETKQVDVVSLAEMILKERKLECQKKNLKIQKTYDKNIPRILTDSKQITMIFQNLLSNAIKYTPARGTVSLSIGVRDSDLIICVADTGMGIPKEVQPQIFTRFFRADNAKRQDTEGTGLGLYILRVIVDQMGGKIWFKSQENKGTTFYITLPKKVMPKKGKVSS